MIIHKHNEAQCFSYKTEMNSIFEPKFYALNIHLIHIFLTVSLRKTHKPCVHFSSLLVGLSLNANWLIFICTTFIDYVKWMVGLYYIQLLKTLLTSLPLFSSHRMSNRHLTKPAADINLKGEWIDCFHLWRLIVVLVCRSVSTRDGEIILFQCIKIFGNQLTHALLSATYSKVNGKREDSNNFVLCNWNGNTRRWVIVMVWCQKLCSTTI
jgi:hypothetical protein